MFRQSFRILAVSSIPFLVVTALPGMLLAQKKEKAEPSRFGAKEEGASEEARSFILTRRLDNDAYGTSAFSFLKNTNDVAEHGNYVDLVFNGCGQLHFNPVGGMESRVADLGENKLDVAVDMDEERFWADDSFPPQKDHVYLHDVKSNGQTMTVKFRVDEITNDELKISWEVVKEATTGHEPSALAGTMGQCGGHHQAR